MDGRGEAGATPGAGTPCCQPPPLPGTCWDAPGHMRVSPGLPSPLPVKRAGRPASCEPGCRWPGTRLPICLLSQVASIFRARASELWGGFMLCRWGARPGGVQLGPMAERPAGWRGCAARPRCPLFLSPCPHSLAFLLPFSLATPLPPGRQDTTLSLQPLCWPPNIWKVQDPVPGSLPSHLHLLPWWLNPAFPLATPTLMPRTRAALSLLRGHLTTGR